ncbi:MAG: radical SAM protein [Candidatus Heimdallarchaeota archaeon]|nr:MAG: radical SAM protein [Candidatus Heimdallarchaeota archaeon]
MIIEEYYAKTLMRNSSPSLFSWSEHYLNPYQGCYHDCQYCDGKSEVYHMHEDFGNRIRVKKNAPHLLERFLKKQGMVSGSTLEDHLKLEKKGPKPKFILFIGGGVCDVYQPAEKQVKMTRTLLHLAYMYNVPVQILTKNTLVLRDLDLFKKINERTYAAVNFSITLADENAQEIFEPRASTTSERFKAIQKLREERIHSGVYFYPPLPFIGDTDENMNSIFQEAKKVGAEFVYVWSLTLKPGRNKEGFFRTIQKQYPHLLSKYRQLYGNNNKYGTLDHFQLKKFNLIYPEIKAYKFNHEFELPYTSRRYIPPGRIENNLRLAEILMRAAYVSLNIIQEKGETYQLNKAAAFLETHPEDVYELDRSEFKKLNIPQAAHPYIIDFFLNGKSILLEELEKKAYFVVLDKLKRLT